MTAGGSFASRRDALVAQAAAEREALARALEPIAKIDRAFDRVRGLKPPTPGIAAAASIGLSALFLLLPRRKLPIVRTGIAVLHLAGAVKRLFTSRHDDSTVGAS